MKVTPPAIVSTSVMMPTPSLTKITLTTPLRRRPSFRQMRQKRLLVAMMTLAVVGISMYFWLDATVKVNNSLNDANNHHERVLETRSSLPMENDPIVEQTDRSMSVYSASLGKVEAFLLSLAQKNPSDLWTLFGKDQIDGSENSYGEDPFSLKYLEKGICPWTDSNISQHHGKSIDITVDWLPPKPLHSQEIAEKFRTKYALDNEETEQMIASVKRGRKIEELSDPSDEVILWYEHLSKAGGTSFCEIVNSNMPKLMVPKYHCMPRKGELIDGRVGSWSNAELKRHTKEQLHRVVSNEWDPFDLNKLVMSGRKIDDLDSSKSVDRSATQQQELPPGPNLLFMTTLRDPCDRLLSAYTFFAITSTSDDNPPTFQQWTTNNVKRCKNYKPGTRSAYRSNTARLNHIVWRFSGGSLPHLPTDEDMESERGRAVRRSRFPPPITDEEVWVPPFKTAIKALANHDLILPMDVMTKDEGKEAFRRLLGWTRIEITKKKYKKQPESSSGQVVTVGGVKNSNARESLEDDEYRALWERNWLDNILFLWTRAVFFARLHCDVEDS